MGGVDGGTPLGVFLPDRARSIVVISGDGELAVSLRERVDRALVLIRDVRPHECAAALAACLPWPWMITGDLPLVPAAVRSLVRARPVLVMWLGANTLQLPAPARVFPSFAALAAAVSDALRAQVGPLRLAPYRGVVSDSGRNTTSAGLDALVAAHPAGFPLPLRAFRSAARALQTLDINLRLVCDPKSGRIQLANQVIV